VLVRCVDYVSSVSPNFMAWYISTQVLKGFQRRLSCGRIRQNYGVSSSSLNVANWDTTPVFVKATGGLLQPGRSPVCNSIVFALFEEKYDVQR